MSIAKKHYIETAVILAFMLINLGGCSTYPNKFKCGDAKGLGCTMLREVDIQIDSGKIEEAYKSGKRCKGSGCNKNKDASIASRESLSEVPQNKATINRSDEIDLEDDLDNIYF